VRDSGYLTIEETARKLGRPASWVKDQICEGKLGATLAGRQWLISPQDFDELLLNYALPREPAKIVHNFLPDRPKSKPHSTLNDQKASRSAQRSEASRRSRKSSSPAKERRPKKDKDWKPTLTQKIKELDREFDQLSSHLRSATLEYRAAIKSGKKVNPPNDLLRQWKTAKAELKRLIAKAHAKDLVLPTNLHIYTILAQEAGLVNDDQGHRRLLCWAGSWGFAGGPEGAG
jgi:excisionase family DNA binding protein